VLIGSENLTWETHLLDAGKLLILCLIYSAQSTAFLMGRLLQRVSLRLNATFKQPQIEKDAWNNNRNKNLLAV